MMQPIPVNIIALLVSGIASMIIGFLWYGPLFGKAWMKLSGITQKGMDEAKKKGMTKSYLIMFVTSLIMVYVLAHALAYAQAQTITDALLVAFWNWLGFIATVQMSSVLWDGKPFKLYLLNVGYHLVSLLVIAVILTVWM